MSYDIYLADPETGEACQLKEPHHMKGGTYAIGGTQHASLNVTYNYSDRFAKAFYDGGGVRNIYGLTGIDSISVLTDAIDTLSGEPSDSYWESTEGNAKLALKQLLTLAKLCPDGVWTGD